MWFPFRGGSVALNAGAALLLGGCVLGAPVGETPTAPVPAGNHDATAHHSFANVAHWAAVFDDPTRDEWQRPAAVVRALGLRSGMRVADLGAGTGYFSRYLSAAVGDEGTVFAVDTEPKLVAYLRERSEKEGTRNVVPILASPDNPRLPVGGADLILVVDTFHHIDARLNYFGGLRRLLKPSGRVAIIDWQKRRLPVGPGVNHKLSRQQVIDEMTAAGYELLSEPAFLPNQYFLIFRISRWP